MQNPTQRLCLIRTKNNNQPGTTMDNNKTVNVVVTDIQMPFMSMVVFMVKWVIAAIPAMIILTILGGIVAAVFGGFASS